jgi:hypothetical protein
LVISSQFAQFLINEREQLSGGFGITLLDVVQNLCEVAHLGDTNDAKRGGRGKAMRKKGPSWRTIEVEKHSDESELKVRVD